MPDIIIRRKHFEKDIVRKLHAESLNPEYIRGAVWGLRHAFDMQDYDIELTEVTKAQEQAAAVRTPPPARA